MASEQFSMRMSKETKDKLEELAKATGRSKAFIANEAIEKYCDLEAWQIMAIQEGIRQADRGELIPHEYIKQLWENK